MARPPVVRSSPAMLATSRGFVEYSRFSACSLRRRFGCDTLNGYPRVSARLVGPFWVPPPLRGPERGLVGRPRHTAPGAMNGHGHFSSPPPPATKSQGRSGPCASAARSGRRFTGARGAWRPSAREVGALAGVDARRTWRPSRGVRGAAVTATSWGWGRVDDNGWRGCGPLQERRQIRCLIVFARTRTHREGILTPGRRRGQRPASILWQPRDLSGLSPSGGHVSMPAPG